MRFVNLILGTFLSVNAFALDVHFDLTGTDGKKITAVLSGYDYAQAIVSTKANFCGSSSSVTTWSIDTTTKLIVDGTQYLIDADNSFEEQDPRTGTDNKFYYSTYTFKDHATCQQVFDKAVASHEPSPRGLIQESDLSGMRISFVIRQPDVDSSLAQVQLKLDFDKHEVQLWTLKDQTFNMFDSSNWVLTGTGTF